MLTTPKSVRRCKAGPLQALPGRPSSSACRDRRAPAATRGTAFRPSARLPYAALHVVESCLGWTSICAARRRRERRRNPSFRVCRCAPAGMTRERSFASVSQVSPTRSTPKLWCFSSLTEAEAGALVDGACGDQNALRPQRYRCVRRPRVRSGCIVRSARPSPSPRLFLTGSRAQLGDVVGRLDQKDRAGRFAADFRDPAMLARGIV